MKTYHINPDGTPYEEPEGAEKILKNFREAFSDESVNEILLLNNKLQQQLKEAREALEFYADSNSWKRGHAGHGEVGDMNELELVYTKKDKSFLFLESGMFVAQQWLKKYGGE